MVQSVDFGSDGQQNTRSGKCDGKIHRRAGDRDANVAFPGQDAGLDRLLSFIEQGNSADGQQDDGFGGNSSMGRNQRVSQFVQ